MNLTRVYSNKELEMGEYLLVETTSPTVSFRYKDLASCSAIVFKCERGFAGFHYPAQVLLSSYAEYSKEMIKMIKYIEQGLGKINSVRCFTPKPLFDDCNVDKDICAIENFFKDYNFELVESIKDVSTEIYF